MPPRTRGTKTNKGLKENSIVEKNKLKSVRKGTKPARKPLADKTNSASDDNSSIDRAKQVAKKAVTASKVTNIGKENVREERPRRDRRLPNRFIGNHVLKNMSNNKENSDPPPREKSAVLVSSNKNLSTSAKTDDCSLFKTPQKNDDSSLLTARPRRISRLPSKFDDHSISPSKFIPMHPYQASTPIIKSKANSKITVRDTNMEIQDGKILSVKELLRSTRKKDSTTIHTDSANINKKVDKKIRTISDTNNNAKQGRSIRPKRINPHAKTKSTGKSSKATSKNSKFPKLIDSETPKANPPKFSPEKKAISLKSNSIEKNTKTASKYKRLPKLPHSGLPKVNSNELLSTKKKAISPRKGKNVAKPSQATNISFRLFGSKYRQDKEENNKDDVYDFTFDPNEEPPPPKKKKKRVVRKKPAKPAIPKSIVFKNNYDQNLSKALQALKSVVSKKTQAVNTNKSLESQQTGTTYIAGTNVASTNFASTKNVASMIAASANVASTSIVDILPSTSAFTHSEQNQVSVQIEDIAADFQPSIDHDIDYSPVNTPHRVIYPSEDPEITTARYSNNPLNLRENALSFFDDLPVASSSMNVSARHPHASPWRVEFQNFPIKWQVGSYVKPNMTPAMECSFVNFDENKKKHVYTNIVPHSSEVLSQVAEKLSEPPNLKQSSIISFIKEVMEKNASKKKKSATPTKDNSHDDVNNVEADTNPVVTASKSLCTPSKNADENSASSKNNTPEDTSNKINTASDKEHSKESLKRKNNEDSYVIPAKTPRKEKDNTFFGFDDSENLDQENVSPKKADLSKTRGLRSRRRGVLKEINAHTGPTRAMLPIATKSKTVNAEIAKLYEEMKSATAAPVVPEENPVDIEITDANDAANAQLFDDDSQSVHFFEDIEVIHHLKAPRKSYGKAKKVTFQQHTTVGDTQDSTRADRGRAGGGSSDEEDLHDITFEMPVVKKKRAVKKKITKKQKMSKKEELEAEAWAAGFNSMCEDVEEFPLLVEGPQ